MPVSSRREIATAQARLAKAVTGVAPPPPGFDSTSVSATVAALARKRRREVAAVWPRLCRALGDQFASRFAEYAQSTPRPAGGHPLEDGFRFARYLARARDLNDEVCLELVLVRASRGWAALARLPQSGGLVVAVRFPWLGTRYISIPAFGTE